MWYHYDRLGNVMDITDENGNLSASYDQDAFGNVLEGNSAGYHLTTKEYSPPISLYYFYQRWYDPLLGRFISRVYMPIYYEHPYTFVENNPLYYCDPNGRFPMGVTHIANMLINCGIATYIAYLIAECYIHCLEAYREMEKNPNIPEEVKCKFRNEGCRECTPLLSNIPGASFSCAISIILKMVSPGSRGKVPGGGAGGPNLSNCKRKCLHDFGDPGWQVPW